MRNKTKKIGHFGGVMGLTKLPCRVLRLGAGDVPLARGGKIWRVISRDRRNLSGEGHLNRGRGNKETRGLPASIRLI